jgi:hypothetical protein
MNFCFRFCCRADLPEVGPRSAPRSALLGTRDLRLQKKNKKFRSLETISASATIYHNLDQKNNQALGVLKQTGIRFKSKFSSENRMSHNQQSNYQNEK